MSGASYRERAPRASLREHVRCVWTFEAPGDEAAQHIAPDGRPELIAHCAAPCFERSGGQHVEQSSVLFAGQLTQPLVLTARRRIACVGVRLEAWACRALLGIPADRATDRRLDLTALHGLDAAKLARQALDIGEPERVAVLAEDYVERRLRAGRIDGDVREAAAALFAGGEAPAPARLSERQWQRRFKAEVGVSPRMLQAILRFRRVFDAIETPERPGWVEAALSAGYFDQPQMARDFRRFLGCTARDWAAQRWGLAKALTQARVGNVQEA